MRIRLLAIALAATVILPTPALAQEAEAPYPARVRSHWGGLPLTAATLSTLMPGLGHLAMGEVGPAAGAFAATAAPLYLASINAPPVVFADLPEARSSLWALTSQEVWFMQAYLAYMAARKRIDNQGYTQPYRAPSVPDLLLAPAKPEHLSDWRVWTTVWLAVVSNVLLEMAMPDPPQAETPYVFGAKQAYVGGRPVPVEWGYGAHVFGSGVLSAHAGIGEEVFFRGVIQDEAERHLGPWGGLAVGSSLFGLVHVGGINQTSPAKQFLATGLGGLYLGGLYQLTGHDLEKAIAAHTYYDIAAFSLSGLYPLTRGNNVFGIQYDF